METKEQLSLRLKGAIRKYDNKRDRSRFLSIFTKVSTTVLGGAVVVLLGWKHNKESVETLTNIALICGALVPIMNTAESFFCLSKRWTSYKKIYVDLKLLKQDMDKNLTENNCDQFSQKLDEIMIEARDAELTFHQMRNQNNTTVS